MVLWKDKQDWQTFNQTHQEKKRKDPKKQNQKWKRRDYNWYHRNTKDFKKLLWRIVCQQIWKPGWNGQISRKIKSSKTESRRSRKPEQTNNSRQNWSSNQKTPNTQMPWTRWFHRRILQSILGRANPYPPQTTRINPKWWRTPKLFLWRQHHSIPKTR